jgi:hypothetical protein
MWLCNFAGHDAWLGAGFGGQRLLMVPALDAVLVSTNQTEKNGLRRDDTEFFVKEWFL